MAVQSLERTRPSAADIDVFGLTHRGHVRETNADQFLVASFHRVLRVHATSLTREAPVAQETESRGYILLVADGVGGLASAGEGSARALTAITEHLLHTTEICSYMALTREADVVRHLRESMMHAHRALLELTEHRETAHATTLSLVAAFWPRAFVLHAGDSRVYRLREGRLERLTTDQTVAQMMVEVGAMSPDSAEASHLKHVLWSALGSTELAPEVIVTDCDRRDVILLCTDGLTKHVTDDEIHDALSRNAEAEDTCRRLVQLALDRGGHDNVTAVVGRIRRPSAEQPVV